MAKLQRFLTHNILQLSSISFLLKTLKLVIAKLDKEKPLNLVHTIHSRLNVIHFAPLYSQSGV